MIKKIALVLNNHLADENERLHVFLTGKYNDEESI